MKIITHNLVTTMFVSLFLNLCLVDAIGADIVGRNPTASTEKQFHYSPYNLQAPDRSISPSFLQPDTNSKQPWSYNFNPREKWPLFNKIGTQSKEDFNKLKKIIPAFKFDNNQKNPEKVKASAKNQPFQIPFFNNDNNFGYNNDNNDNNDNIKNADNNENIKNADNNENIENADNNENIKKANNNDINKANNDINKANNDIKKANNNDIIRKANNDIIRKANNDIIKKANNNDVKKANNYNSNDDTLEFGSEYPIDSKESNNLWYDSSNKKNFPPNGLYNSKATSKFLSDNDVVNRKTSTPNLDVQYNIKDHRDIKKDKFHNNDEDSGNVMPKMFTPTNVKPLADSKVKLDQKQHPNIPSSGNQNLNRQNLENGMLYHPRKVLIEDFKTPTQTHDTLKLNSEKFLDFGKDVLVTTRSTLTSTEELKNPDVLDTPDNIEHHAIHSNPIPNKNVERNNISKDALTKQRNGRDHGKDDVNMKKKNVLYNYTGRGENNNGKDQSNIRRTKTNYPALRIQPVDYPSIRNMKIRFTGSNSDMNQAKSKPFRNGINNVKKTINYRLPGGRSSPYVSNNKEDERENGHYYNSRNYYKNKDDFSRRKPPSYYYGDGNEGRHFDYARYWSGKDNDNLDGKRVKTNVQVDVHVKDNKYVNVVYNKK